MKNSIELKILSEKYPTISNVNSETINLKAILSLPKGTEHFVSDIHGEFEEFSHIIRNGSGVIKRKIIDLFEATTTEYERRELATLIYYPEETLKKIKTKDGEWLKTTLERLIEVCRLIASKYTRSKVRKALPHDFAYIVEELLHEQEHKQDKQKYYQEIVKAIIDTDQAEAFIQSISTLIQRLSIDHLHIVGDIFDRGPDADKVMNLLMEHKNIDIQFGNHDILWMGAFGGSQVCVANIIRLALKNNNTSTIEKAYSISLKSLKVFANDVYDEDNAQEFQTSKNLTISQRRMYKAITMIQFKLEKPIIKNHPEFEMNDRLLLSKMDLENQTVEVGGKHYSLKSKHFPTICKSNPYKHSKQENILIEELTNQFMNSTLLSKHMAFLYKKGDLFKIYNKNLLIHGCIPFEDNITYSKLEIGGKIYSGQQLLKKLDSLIKGTHYNNENNLDYFFYLWQGPQSPLYGRGKMTTFERLFIEDETTWHEPKNAYFEFRDNHEIVNQILNDFDLDINESHIINGHQPVRAIEGEDPVKANGKVIVIDGGFSEGYHSVTGIKGYTLINNSWGLLLVEHQEFESTKNSIENYKDIVSSGRILKLNEKRKLVRDTDIGQELEEKISALQQLVTQYKKGFFR